LAGDAVLPQLFAALRVIFPFDGFGNPTGDDMKKLFLATLAGLALIPGSAFAADMAAPVYKAAPPPPPAFNWSGIYINAGGGYGMWSADTQVLTPGGACVACAQQTASGTGYLGTVGGGFDVQLGSLGFGNWNPTIVAGLFGDYNFSSIKGTIEDPSIGLFGTSGYIKDTDAWAGGARLGVGLGSLVLTYVNGGVTGHRFSGATLDSNITGAPVGITTAAFNKTGWFLGGGTETSLSGVLSPGWFWRSEYRYSYLGTTSVAELPVADVISFHPMVQTLTSSIVYKFNWMGR
jgi:outer membrane immunogenic protein